MIYDCIYGTGRYVVVGRGAPVSLLEVSRHARNDLVAYLRKKTYVFLHKRHVRSMELDLPQRPARKKGRQSTYDRPYITSVAFNMSFLITNQPTDQPIHGARQISLPEEEVAPINKRDVTFLLGVREPPLLSYVGSRLYEQYGIAAEILRWRAHEIFDVPLDEHVDLPGSQLLFMRRNWDYIFSTWHKCGFANVTFVELHVERFRPWVEDRPSDHPTCRWRPYVDFFRLLMRFPETVKTIQVSCEGSQHLRRVYEMMLESHEPDYVYSSADNEFRTRMDDLYKKGKLGCQASKTTWFNRLIKRHNIIFTD